MIIKILSKQVPLFWEAIKFATIKADEVESKDLQPYFNELLHSLLSDKAQCFVGLDDKKTLIGILITRVLVDRITEEKYLLLQSVYTWEKLEDQVWGETFDLFRQFAVKEGCKYLSYSSSNPAIWDRAEKLGFKEKTRTFSLQI